MDKSMARLTFTMIILSVAAAVTLILGVIGLYGVIAYIVRRDGAAGVLRARRELDSGQARGAGEPDRGDARGLIGRRLTETRCADGFMGHVGTGYDACRRAAIANCRK